MEHFKFLTPKNIGEAFDLLEKHKNDKIRIFAGGTDTIPLLRAKVIDVDYFLDISNLGMDKIEECDDFIKIGARVTFTELGENEIIKTKLPAVAYAATQVGAVQTRSIATIGGNISSAVPSLDSAPALMALDASLVIVSKDSSRTVPMDEFFVGPRRSILKPNEILSQIIIPIPKAKTGVDFIKFGRRKALTLSIINSAASLELNDSGEISKARIVLGAVAITPVRARKAEEALVGQIPSLELFEKVSSTVDQEINPITDIRATAEFRKHLSTVLVKRNLVSALKQIQD